MTPVAKRMTAAEKANAARLRDLKHLAEVALARPPRSADQTVTITRNAKGQWQFSVEITHSDPSQARTLATACAQYLDAEFPYDNGSE